MPIDRDDPFSDYSEQEENNDNENSILSIFSNKKIVTIGSVILLIFILLFLALIVAPIIRPDLFLNTNKIKVQSSDGKDVAFKGSLTKNGELVDTFLSEGTNLTEKTNPHETKTIVLKTSGLPSGVKTASGVIVLGNGTRIQLSEDAVTISSDGTVTILINPEDDLGLSEEELQGLIDGSIDFNLILTIENTESDGSTDVLTLEIPVTLLFSEFSGVGCIEISRETVSETTHAGVLSVDVKVRVTCETSDALYGVVTFKGERSGNVEFLFNDYSDGSTLTTVPLKIKNTIPIGTYSGKIIFTPLTEYAGQKTEFSVTLGSGNSEAKVNFNVAIDNLEQCISVTSKDSTIENESDYASITVDATKCASDKIDILLCDGDPTCSFTSEGGINLQTNVFSLVGSQKTKTVSIERGEIPGVYGVTVKARIPGLEKTFIDEIEILVRPTIETIAPDRFVVSLLGKGSKDSVKVKNTELSEPTKIDASICTLYNNSLGINSNSYGAGMGSSVSPISGFGFESSWWRKITTEQKYYSGIGKYELALAGSTALIDNARITTQQISSQKNALIKQVYLSAKAIKPNVDAAVDLSTQANKAMQDLDAAAGKYNDYIEQKPTLTYSSLAAQTLTLTNAGVTATEAYSAATTASTAATALATCPAMASTQTTLQSASSSAYNGGYILTSEFLVSAAGYANTIDKLAEDGMGESIDTSAASDYAKEAESITTEIQNDSIDVDNLADQILIAASVDSTSSISSDYYLTKDLLTQLKTKNDAVYQKLLNDRETHLKADDELTTTISGMTTNTDLILAGAALLDTLVNAITQLITDTSLAGTQLGSAVTQLTAADDTLTVASIDYSTACSTCWDTLGASCEETCKCATATSSAKTSSSSALVSATDASKGNGILGGTAASSLSALQLMAQIYTTWLGMTGDISTELIDAKTKNQKALDSIDKAIIAAEDTKNNIDAAIEAANYLATESASTSYASTFTADLTSSSESFDRTTLTGLVATAVANGFINGAYEGGVYTTKDTRVLNTIPTDTSNVQTSAKEKERKVTLSNSSVNNSLKLSDMQEDCANRVELELMDYKTNLLNDAKDVVVTNGDVLSYWSFSDPKVYGFYESQEVGLVFANSSLKKTSYGVVSLTATKHNHAPLTTISGGEFGPFNVPDSSAQEVTYKYHFKFNGAPRKTASTVSSAVCESGLLKGNTGENALPKTILSWNWNDIDTETVKDNYIDSTQLSILVSDKIKLFDEFMSRTSLSCPKNEAYSVLEKIKPTEVTLTQPACHLPVSTRVIEGKPSIFYFLNSVSTPPEGYDEFFQGNYASSAEQANNFIDFNVLLMRDGLGTNFQSDFVTDYTGQILKSSPGFTDPISGMSKYFEDSTRFFYSAEYNDMKKSESFILPDAGLYNVRILIDYDDATNPQTSLGGLKNAKIIVNPVLVQAVNKNYSPFYYTPFDGSVGLNTNNNRKYYGTSINSGARFNVSSEDGSFLSNQQKDALVKINQKTLDNFYWINSLPSNRGKILDYVYSFSNSSSDTNSMLVFSPTIVTPMIISTTGTSGTNPIVTYALTKNAQKIDPVTNNLLIVSGLNGCYDFSGNLLTRVLNKSPDTLMGDYYGLNFNNATTSGTVSVKTTAYLPVGQQYDIGFNPGGQIMTTNQQIPSTTSVPMDGIKGMKYNDISNDSYITGLKELFDAVKQKSVCVSNLGDRETYWWAEDYLFEKENSEGKSLHDKELELTTSCIKQ